MASSSSNTDDSFMSSFTRHQRLMNGYIKQKKALKLSSTDGDVLKEKHRFIRNDKEDEKEAGINWEIRMAMKYYRRLHKEYALVDLSRYKDGKIGLRWRTEDEVVNGKVLMLYFIPFSMCWCFFFLISFFYFSPLSIFLYINTYTAQYIYIGSI